MYVRFKLILFFLFLNLGNRKILGTDAFCWNCEIKVKKKRKKSKQPIYILYKHYNITSFAQFWNLCF